MRLVLSTAHEACSAALIAGGRVLAARHEPVGRGQAERLVPLIAALLAEAGADRADAILVDIGPGSFTGTRLGIAAARALGLAWSVPVDGIGSDTLVAASAFAHSNAPATVAVLLDAGRGRCYGALHRRCGSAEPAAAIEVAAAAALAARAEAVAGNAHHLLPPGPWRRLTIEPDARAAALLPPGLPRLPAAPLYLGGAGWSAPAS